MTNLLKDPVITKIADAHGKNAGQVILRFEVQEGIIVFPKSTKPERIKSNMDIFDFELTESEMNEMRVLTPVRAYTTLIMEGVAEFLLANYDVHAND